MEKKLVLFTRTKCSRCNIMKRMLTSKNVIDKVEIINLDEQPEYIEDLQKQNLTGLPVLINKQTSHYVVGVDIPKLQVLLKEI